MNNDDIKFLCSALWLYETKFQMVSGFWLQDFGLASPNLSEKIIDTRITAI